MAGRAVDDIMKDASQRLEAAPDLLSQIYSLICAMAAEDHHLQFQSEFGMLLKQVFSLRLAFNGLMHQHAGMPNYLDPLAFVRNDLTSSYELNHTLSGAQQILQGLHKDLLQENHESFIFVRPSFWTRAPQYDHSPCHRHPWYDYSPLYDYSPRHRQYNFWPSEIQHSRIIEMPKRSDPFLDLDDSIEDFLSEPAIQMPHILGIIGQGGIGKTTLMLQILKKLQSQKAFSLIVYVEFQNDHAKFLDDHMFFHDDNDTKEVQISVLLQLGGSVANIRDELSARRALLRRFDELAAAHESVCIAFDNTVVEVDRLLQWIPLGDSSLRSCVMITSRKEMVLGDELRRSASLALEQTNLRPETARDLLLAFAGVKGRQGHIEVSKLVDEIYPLCGGIPLALKCVGSLLAEVRDLDFWEGWKRKMKGSRGFPLANEFEQLNDILQRSYQCLHWNSQEALLDIATFVHGWNWDTVECILSDRAMQQLRKFFLIYRTNQEFVSSYRGPEYVIMHDLMRKLVVEKMGETCLVLGNQEEFSTLLLSNKSVLSRVRCLQGNIGGGGEIPLPSDEACLSLDGNCFSLMHSLRILDLSGTFKCNELWFPESLRYLRLANNDGLGNQLTKAKIPSRLWHFELQQCKGVLELPLSIYECKDLVSLKLWECPNLRGFRSYCSWWRLKELHIKGCQGITQLPIDLDYLNLVTLNDCQNLQARPPLMSEQVKIENCPYLLQADVTSTYYRQPISIAPIKVKSTRSPADDQMRTSDLRGRLPVHACGEAWKLSSTSLQLTLQDCDCLDLGDLEFEDLTNLRKLKLQYCQHLIWLPGSICKLKSLVVLDLHGCSELPELPRQIDDLSALEVLDLSECRKLRLLPVSLPNIKSLKELNLCGCAQLGHFPYNMENLSSLKILRLGNCRSLRGLEIKSICKLKELLHLDLHGCSNIMQLPEEIGSLSALETLFLMECHSITTLPNSISNLQSLRVFSIDGCSQLKELPEQAQSLKALTVFGAANCVSLQNLYWGSMCELKSLSVLDLQGCLNLEELPEEFGYNLASLTSLLLMECQKLKSLPEGICRITMLEELDVSGCSALESLPEDMGNLRALRKLRLANCESLERLPHSICHLQSLVNLDLHGCYKLQELPRDFGELSALQTLNLLKCQSLHLVPKSACTGLKSLKELDMRGSLVERILQVKNSYFVDGEKARSFLRSQFGEASNQS